MDAATLARQVESIAASMKILLAPGQIVEVRALHPFASRVFATAEAGALERLAEFAARQSGRSKGVYFTPNPLKSVRLSGKGNTAEDKDVECRRWLLIDVDPERPDKVKANSSDAEHELALSVARRIHNALQVEGYRGLILSDSGNGASVMAPVNWDNDDVAYQAHAAFLADLQERFGSMAVEMDPKVKNAARIWKLPGTFVMKGPDTPERPRRYAKMLEVSP